MKVEEHSERKIDIDGWPVNLTSYRIGETFHCKADNVSPGAALARTTGATRQEAEDKAIARARLLRIGAHLCVGRVDVFNAARQLAATALVTYMLLRSPVAVK